MKENNKLIIDDLYIHFDIKEWRHEVPITQSIITEQSVNIVIQELNKHIFNNKLDLEVIVYSNEDWWLVKRFWVKIYLVWWFLIWALAPDILNWIVMWLWDWEKEVKSYVKDWTILVKEVLTDSFEWFMSIDNKSLQKNWVSIDKFHKWYYAKNNFYQEAIKNKSVSWIWFDKTHDFPVSRQEFYHRISDLQWDNTNIKPIDKYHNLLVVSPINTKEDKKLAWQVKDKVLKERFSVYMKDNDFYNTFLEKPFYLKELLVKVRYFIKINDIWDKYIDRKDIMKVYKYDDVNICSLPDDVKIEIAPFDILDNDLLDKEESSSNEIEQTSLKLEI